MTEAEYRSFRTEWKNVVPESHPDADDAIRLCARIAAIIPAEDAALVDVIKRANHAEALLRTTTDERDAAITRAETAEAALAKATTDLDASEAALAKMRRQRDDLNQFLNDAHLLIADSGIHAPGFSLLDRIKVLLNRLTEPAEKDFTAVCLDCGVVSTCDEDRCCESCGGDLVLCADGPSADLLIAHLKDVRKEHDQAEELAAARSEIDRLRVSLRAAIRGARQLAIAADFLNGGDDA